MARVNVFLPQDLLEAVDAEAERAGMNRSAFVQEALSVRLDALRRAREDAEAQRRVDRACKRIDAVAEKLLSWDAVGSIRKDRDSRGVRAPAGSRRK